MTKIFSFSKNSLLGAYFLLAEDSEEMLFPEFYASIQGKTKGDALDSKASNILSKLYTRMMKIVNDFEGKYMFIYLLFI